MEYIRYHEMELLFTHYHDITGAIQSIKREIEGFNKGVDSDETDNIITSMALNHTPINKVASHTTGHVSDKTGTVALSYQQTLDNQHNALFRELAKELLLLELIKDKLEIAFNSLKPSEREILEAKCWNNMTWDEIYNKYFISRGTGHNKRKEGIEKLIRISRITVQQYRQINKILGL